MSENFREAQSYPAWGKVTECNVVRAGVAECRVLAMTSNTVSGLWIYQSSRSRSGSGHRRGHQDMGGG